MGTILSSSDPGVNDFAVETVKAGRIAMLLLASRFSMRGNPLLVNVGADVLGIPPEEAFKALSSSGVVSIPQASWGGVDLMSSVAEGSSPSSTDMTTAAVTVTPADFFLYREVTDKARRRDPTGLTDPMSLALDMVASAGMSMTNSIAKIVDDRTQVGTTGTAFTHDTFLAGQFALEQGLVPGPYGAMLKPKQYTDWQTDLEARSGVTQWRPATEQMQQLSGEGVKGGYNNVLVMTSHQVQTANAGADYAGGIWGRGAFGYLEEPQAPPVRSQVIIMRIGNLIVVEEKRDAVARTTGVVGGYSYGVVTIEGARARTFISGV